MFIALRSIVTAEMMGVHKLNNAFGLTIFFQGVAGTAGSPLAGNYHLLVTILRMFCVVFSITGSALCLEILNYPIIDTRKW